MWWGNAQGSMAKDFEDLLAFGAPGAGGAETKQIFDRGCESQLSAGGAVSFPCMLSSSCLPWAYPLCHLTSVT